MAVLPPTPVPSPCVKQSRHEARGLVLDAAPKQQIRYYEQFPDESMSGPEGEEEEHEIEDSVDSGKDEGQLITSFDPAGSSLCQFSRAVPPLFGMHLLCSGFGLLLRLGSDRRARRGTS